MKRFFRILTAGLALSLWLSGCGLMPAERENKNGDAAKRPNIIAHYELKPFLTGQEEQAQENLFAMYYAMANFEKTCYLPYPVPQEQAQTLLALLCYQCPELFQVDLTQTTTYHSYEGSSDVIAVDFPYCMDKATYDALLAQAQEALGQFDTAGMTLLEAEKYIYDILCRQITYTVETEHCENIYGALVEGKAKCDGISKAMAWVMENAGFPCMTVAGHSYEDGVGHAWNVIPVDGHNYHLDLTADVQSEEQHEPLYPAYNLSADFMLAAYAPTDAFLIPPEADTEGSYHALQGSFFVVGSNWRSAVKKLFQSAYKESGAFTVQFASLADFEACMDSLESLFREAAQEAGIYHWAWATTYIRQYHLIHVQIQS